MSSHDSRVHAYDTYTYDKTHVLALNVKLQARTYVHVYIRVYTRRNRRKTRARARAHDRDSQARLSF
jgi:hypothetical protein